MVCELTGHGVGFFSDRLFFRARIARQAQPSHWHDRHIMGRNAGSSLDESGCADLDFEGDPFAIDIGSFVNKLDSSLFKPSSDSTSVTSSSLETLDDYPMPRNMDNYLAKKMEGAHIEDASEHDALFVHADERDSWWL